MLTYSHTVIGYLAFLKKSSRARKFAGLGGIAPDLLLLIGFLFQVPSVVVAGSPAHEFHMAVHRVEIPQAITNSLHSIPLMVPVALIGIMWWKPIFPFFAGIFLHIGVDFLTHQEWPYTHLYPFDVEPVAAVALWGRKKLLLELDCC